MKLIRHGELGKEKIGIILNDEYYDTSSFGEDYNEHFFESDGLNRLQKFIESNKNMLSKVPKDIRLGSPVSRPSKIICIAVSILASCKRMEKLSLALCHVIYLLIFALFTHLPSDLLAPSAVGRVKTRPVSGLLIPASSWRFKACSFLFFRIVLTTGCNVISTGLPVFFWMILVVRTSSLVSCHSRL